MNNIGLSKFEQWPDFAVKDSFHIGDMVPIEALRSYPSEVFLPSRFIVKVIMKQVILF